MTVSDTDSTAPGGATAPDAAETGEPAYREVTITADHNGERRDHVFKVTLDLGYKDLIQITRWNTTGNGNVMDLLPVVDRIFRRCMVNTDGVPAGWVPEIVEGRFAAPDGVDHPVGRLSWFTRFDAGSSRRRWRELLADDDVDFTPTVMVDALNTVMGADAERPT